jgi:hypothetical protein
MGRILILLSLSLTSCVGTRNYTMQDHAEMMQHCQLMCDDVGVKLYSPISGTCKCNEVRK